MAKQREPTSGVKVRPIGNVGDIVDVVSHAVGRIEEIRDALDELRKNEALVLAELESVLQFFDPQ